MILINLLPHREEKRRQRKQAFFVGLGAAIAVGVLAVGVWYLVLMNLKEGQQQRNGLLSAEIKRLEGQIKDIANLKAEIESLKARQRAVEDLQTNRNVPVHLLGELTRHTPEGVYLTAIRQSDRIITVNGVAQTNERVSEFLRNTLHNAQWLEKPELVEIKAVNLTAAGSKEQRRLFEFGIRVTVKSPTAPAAGASAPVAARKAD